MNNATRDAVRTGLFSLALSLAALAQEPQPPAESRPRPNMTQPVLVTLSFPGGTLAECVNKIRASEPRANIVVADDAAAATVPGLELRGAGLEQALEGISAVAMADFTVSVREFRGAGEPVYSIVAVSNVGPTPPRAARALREQEDRTATQVFSLNRLTDNSTSGGAVSIGFPAKTILSAVEAAMAGGQMNEPFLRFHQDSGLLIVRGSREQLAIAHEVLASLQRDVEHRERSGAATAPASPPAPDRRREVETK